MDRHRTDWRERPEGPGGAEGTDAGPVEGPNAGPIEGPEADIRDGGVIAPPNQPRTRHRTRDERSVTELIREMAGEGSDLVRQEIALAKAEMREKAEVYQRASANVAIGGALLFASLLAVLWAVNTGLTALLAQWVSVDIAVWLAPLILAVVLAAVGYGLFKKGQTTMRHEGLTPEKTRQSLEQDRSWARSRAEHLKKEMRHD